jgi:hypothetical protein
MGKHLHILILFGAFGLSAYTALGESFTIPKEPLRISNSGFILAPERMNYPTEYGTLFEDGRIKQLTNILLSRGEPLAARCDDGVYRPIHIDRNTGAILISNHNGEPVELNRPESVADLKDYFTALRMDKDPSIQKFMSKYFGHSETGYSNPNQGPHQNPSDPNHGTEKPGKSGGHPTQIPPSDSGSSPKLDQTPDIKPLPQEKTKIPSSQETGETETQQDKLSTQSFRNKRFFFWAIEKETITRRNGREFIQSYGSACGSSLVSRKETNQKNERGEAVCKLAFLTAGHCIPTESEIKFNGDGQKAYTNNIKIRAPNGAEIETGKNFEVIFPPNYIGRRRFRGIDSQGKVVSDEIKIQDDYAMVFIDAPCSKTSPSEVSALAKSIPKAQDRLTAIDQQNLPKPNFLREGSSAVSNQLAATLDQIGDIKPGDSGGPIFDQNNRLVGAISSIETDKNLDKDGTKGHSVTFDPNSPDWVREQLRKRFPEPIVHTEEKLECENGVCKVPKKDESADREPLFPKLNNALNRIIDPLIPDRKTGGLKEVGPVPTRQLDNVLEQAKKNGFKHIVIRYGNDGICKYCRDLRDDLRRNFGKESDVMVIKVEDSVPEAGAGIPQSQLLSLDGSGQWREQVETRIGSGNTAQEFKSHVNQLKRTSQRNQPQAPQAQQPQAPKQARPSIEEDIEERDFECVRSESGFRPRHKEFRKALGAGFIAKLEDCKKAIKASRNGVICASTGLPGGFKPTYLRGVTRSRPDYGYVGGSSMTLQACLYATEHSTESHICYWGGSSWFATHPTGDGSSKGGPFNSLQNCVASYGGNPKVAQKRQPETRPTPEVQPTPQVPPSAQVPQPIATDFSQVYPKLKSRMGSGDSSPESIVIDERYMTQLLGTAGQDKLKKEVVESLNNFKGTKFKPEDVELQLSINRSSNSAISARRKGTDQLIGEVELTPEGKLNEVKPQTRGLTQTAPETPQTPTQTPPPASQVHNAPPSALKAHELINQNCLNCHTGGNARRFPEWMTQPGELERRLASSNATEKAQARAMIEQLHNVLVEDDNMPPTSAVEQRKAFLNDPEAAKFKSWLAAEHAKLNGQNTHKTEPHADSSQQPRATASVARNSIQILPPQKLAAYRGMLPKVENEELEAILRDPNTLFFDRQSMVPGYQDPSTPVSGVRSTEKGFRGAAFGAGAENLYLDKEGHLRTFSHGVGLETAGNTGTFHFIHLPKDANGNLQKIKVVKRIVPPEDTPTYDWVFPVGTVSGEVVFNKDASGKAQVVEIRTRKKDSVQGAWAPDIMRPFPTAGTLKERLTDISANNPSLKSEAQGLLQHLSNPQRLKPLDLKLNGYQKGSFTSRGGTDVLPNMSESMVKELLKTPFKSSLGAEWDRNGNVVAFAPTTNQATGLVPQHGTTGVMRVDRQSCNKCHEESNKPIYNFFDENHPLFNQSIRAYGNLPGSDRNLRFTIFDPRYFRDFGNDGKGDNRRINPQLLPILDMQ